MNPFRQRQVGVAWQLVGLTSEFPDVGLEDNGSRITKSCKAFRIPKANTPQEPEGPIQANIRRPGDLKGQVLVFKYKGKFHAIDHVS